MLFITTIDRKIIKLNHIKEAHIFQVQERQEKIIFVMQLLPNKVIFLIKLKKHMTLKHKIDKMEFSLSSATTDRKIYKYKSN